MSKAAAEGGSALAHAYGRKMRQSWDPCHQEGIEFVPLPVETFGGWHQVALKVLNKLGRQFARHIGKSDSEVLNHMYQRLGILLQKGNCALIASRSPDLTHSSLDGDKDSKYL